MKMMKIDAANEAREVKEALRSVSKAKVSKPNVLSGARALLRYQFTVKCLPAILAACILKRLVRFTASEEAHLAMKIEAGTVASQKLRTLRMANCAEQRRLMRIESVDLTLSSSLSLQTFVLSFNCCAMLDVACCSSILSRNNLGLIRAVEKFDYTKGLCSQHMPW